MTQPPNHDHTAHVAEVPADLYAVRWTDAQLLAVPKPSIENVVSTYSLTNTSLDPSLLSQTMPGSKHDRRKFAACTIRAQRAVNLIFYRGSAVCAGACSVEESRLASLEMANYLLACGHMVQWREFWVRNIVCRAACGFSVDLVQIARHYAMDCDYDPSLFPGLIFRFKWPRIVVIVFISGCCIVTGAKNYNETTMAWAWFYTHVLSRFRLRHGETLSSSTYLARTLQTDHRMETDINRIYRSYVSSKLAGRGEQLVQPSARDEHVSDLLDMFDEDNDDAEQQAVQDKRTVACIDDSVAAQAVLDRLHAVNGPANPRSAALFRRLY